MTQDSSNYTHFPVGVAQTFANIFTCMMMKKVTSVLKIPQYLLCRIIIVKDTRITTYIFFTVVSDMNTLN